jgi:indoleamine 2,3-dioxygenase
MRRAKVIFDDLGQAYVWGEDPPAQIIPAGFAEFWYQISQRAALPPILSYVSYVLYNWRRIDPQKLVALGNIAVVQNFLGGLDEDWFILIHVDIENRAGVIPAAIIGALQALARRDINVLETYLTMITLSLESMLQTLERMPERCDEYIYYTRVRPYLHGWKNNPSLPDGIIYEGVGSYHNKPQQFRGESGAQSSIIPSLVAFLDIRHAETTFTPYLQEMLSYMPNGHRRFIETIEQLSRNGYSILNFVNVRKQSHPSLYDAYRSCRNALYNFRKKHFEYVGRYIHSQAQRHTGNPTAIGTAGTPFMTSLKDLMDETWFE